MGRNSLFMGNLKIAQYQLVTVTNVFYEVL